MVSAAQKVKALVRRLTVKLAHFVVYMRVRIMKGRKMNIDDMKLGDIKKLAAMFGGEQQANSDMIGKYVMVRSRGAGVHAGVLKSLNGDKCTLTHSRRLWYWKTKGADFLSGVTVNGLHRDSKVGCVVDEIYITEVCEVAPATKEARLSIEEQPVHGE